MRARKFQRLFTTTQAREWRDGGGSPNPWSTTAVRELRDASSNPWSTQGREEGLGPGEISLVGTPQGGATTDGTDVTLTFDGEPQVGDVVIVWGGHVSRALTSVGPSTSGYTPVVNDTASSPYFAVAYKVLTDPLDTTVVCHGTGNAGDAIAYASYVLRGVDLPDVQDQTHEVAGPTASTNPDCPAIVTQTENAWVLALALSLHNDFAITVPSNYSNLVSAGGNSGNDASVGGATRVIASPGEEDPPAFTDWNSAAWKACTLAIKAG